MDIVKKGYMYVKKPSSNTKIRLKAWQYKYLVLRDSSLEKSARLEIYDNAEKFIESSPGYSCIELKDVSDIHSHTSSKTYPHAISATSTGHSPVILALEAEDFVREWLLAIKCLVEKERNRPPHQQRRLTEYDSTRRGQSKSTTSSRYSKSSRGSIEPPSVFQDILNGKLPNNKARAVFAVQVQDTFSSLQHKLSGDYNMHIKSDTILLTDVITAQDVYKWPLANVKKFKSESVSTGYDLVTIETGLHSKLSEGVYTFKTNFGEDIVKKVRAAVQGISVRRLSQGQVSIAGSLQRSNKSSSSPNIHSISVGGSSPTLSYTPGIRSVLSSTPPPVPPRSNTTSASSSSSCCIMYSSETVEEDVVFSPGPEEKQASISYARLQHSNSTSDEDAAKHDDSGYSESSDDTIFPLNNNNSTTPSHRASKSPPATLPRANKSEVSLFRPPPLPPKSSDINQNQTLNTSQEQKPALPPKRRSLQNNTSITLE